MTVIVPGPTPAPTPGPGEYAIYPIMNVRVIKVTKERDMWVLRCSLGEYGEFLGSLTTGDMLILSNVLRESAEMDAHGCDSGGQH